MADNKKYYYLKLKENFFESDSMVLLENMKDGYLYSNILLKLYLRSLKDGGRLMLNGAIPYNSQMLASVTRHQVGTVEKALTINVPDYVRKEIREHKEDIEQLQKLKCEIVKEVLRLSLKQKQVIMMFYFQDLKWAQISDLLHYSEPCK